MNMRAALTVLIGLVMRYTTAARFDKTWRNAEPGRMDCGRYPGLKAFAYAHLFSTVAANDIADRGVAGVRHWLRYL